MSEGRPLRVMLVANDGLSAGHVARAVAIAGGLSRVARTRDIALRTALVTTSRAHALLEAAEAVVVQSPAPDAARRAGFTDVERRHLVRGVVEGAVRSFAPDLVVVDTFPRGPHDELAGVDLGHARRALVRRHVPEHALAEPAIARGVEDVDLAILADDPTPCGVAPACPHVRVPPITFARAPLARTNARERLGLPAEGRVFLVAAGGGGDETAREHARTIARAIVRRDPSCVVAIARGPLARDDDPTEPRLRALEAAPMAPLLGAFDAVVTPAGYNTAHELALAGVPAVLFAEPRPFDDQLARAARLDATVLRSFDDDAIARAIAAAKPLTPIAGGGADRAAEALLDLATSPRRGRR